MIVTNSGLQFPTSFTFDVTDNGDSPAGFEEPYTLHEIKMVEMMYLIRKNVDWKTKIKDATIRQKWREEMLLMPQLKEVGEEEQQGEELDYKKVGLMEAHVDWVSKRMEWESDQSEDPNGVQHSAFDKIFESNTLVPLSLLEELKTNLLPLENVAENLKDYHPGTNEQVVNLIHPSLFPLRYDKTYQSKGEGAAEVVDAPTVDSAAGGDLNSVSKKYQWLPTDFKISTDGEVEIVSYINNLHPTQHSALYATISSIFSRFIPLFDKTLSSLLYPSPRRIKIDLEWYTSEDQEPEWPATGGNNREAMDKFNKDYEQWEESRVLKPPAPEAFTPPTSEPPERTFSIKGRTVQVVTKIATIHLTPQKPSYTGGVWHIEGMANERIVATGICYFDNENINNEETKLVFRGTFDRMKLKYEECDHRGVKEVYGIVDNGPAVQLYPSVNTISPLSITFPNIYQHRVTPFSLLDPSKPGHRKILVFFLVDPLRPIPSTSTIQPQNIDWTIKAMGKKLEKLPVEIWDKIWEETGLIGLEETKRDREELMRERKYLQEEGGQFFEQERKMKLAPRQHSEEPAPLDRSPSDASSLALAHAQGSFQTPSLPSRSLFPSLLVCCSGGQTVTGEQQYPRTALMAVTNSPLQFPTSFTFDVENDWDSPAGFEEPYTLHEIKMVEMVYIIRKKVDWKTKIKDAAIRQKWGEEMLVVPKVEEVGEDEEEAELDYRKVGLKEAHVVWVLKRMEWESDQSEDPNGVQHSAFDKIYESTTLIPPSLLQELKTNLLPLENVAENLEDYHPGTNEQVVNLLHPSMFPLRYDKTFQSNGEGAAEVVDAPTVDPAAGGDLNSVSKKYQWLPTDFKISTDGEVEIVSYINNLHPTQHSALYATISSIFSRFIPLFDKTLSSLLYPSPRRIKVDTDWYTSEEPEPEWPGRGDQEAMDKFDRDYEKWEESKILEPPVPQDFTPPTSESPERTFSIKGRTVQVITKIATIHLSPNKPSYPGGVWHIEGMANERIVATGIHYFDNENINNEETKLEFRGSFDNMELMYEQSDDRGVKQVYGIVNDGPTVQLYPSVNTVSPLSITFPNIYQHRVTPFSLLDPSKPGHRKILVFFLVDPLRPIPSTSTIQPQNLDWTLEAIGNKLEKLPIEIWDKIWEETGLIGLEETKRDREELMKERKYLQEEGGQFFERPFSLCEH